YGPGGGGLRGRRHPCRGARKSRRRLVRRRPVALSGTVRAADGQARADLRRRRTAARVTAPVLPCGGARALTRRLSRAPDRLALYAALSDGGRRPDTMLLETLAGPSLILDQAAVRIECRGLET